MEITPELIAWFATPTGIAVIVGIIMNALKQPIKQDGDLWVNVWTLLLCEVLAVFTWFGMGSTLSVYEVFTIFVKGILAYGLATGGYEALSNIWPKK